MCGSSSFLRRFGLALVLPANHPPQNLLRLEDAKLVAPDHPLEVDEVHDLLGRSAQSCLAKLAGEPLVRASALHIQRCVKQTLVGWCGHGRQGLVP